MNLILVAICFAIVSLVFILYGYFAAFRGGKFINFITSNLKNGNSPANWFNQLRRNESFPFYLKLFGYTLIVIGIAGVVCTVYLFLGE
jgi:ammonia channel protein AmtB